MRTKLEGREHVMVRSLSELDALVGQLVMEANPSVHWEDSDSHFQFDSLDDALDLFQDPILMGFVSESPSHTTVLRQVCEFRPYSTTLVAAWEIVDRMNSEALHLRRNGRLWLAAFGNCAEVEAESAAMAISLAALRARGCEVHLEVTTKG